MPREPYGYTTFCDDIRHELHGKFSLIGIYRNEMTVLGSLPAKLPKLGLHITYTQSCDDEFLPIKIKIFMPHQTDEDDDVITMDMDLTKVSRDSIKFADETKPGDEPQFAVNASAVLTDVQLLQPGRIRVRAFRDGKTVKCGTLVVKASEERPDAQAPDDA